MLQSAGGQVELYVCTTASAVKPTLLPEQLNPFLTVGGGRNRGDVLEPDRLCGSRIPKVVLF